jgi:2-(1,2-epoxy-1,2-dihydrophenyl)acetyl-CoA isomerase
VAGSYVSAAGLDVRVEDSVLRLTLNAPERRNALNDSSMAALIEALQQACTDDRLRAVLLEGAGSDFCSGFDILARNAGGSPADRPRAGGPLADTARADGSLADTARAGGSPADRPRTGSIQRRLPTQANRLIPLLLDLQLPVVCAVRGWAVGIGAQLALASDFTVAAADATFWYPFVARGFTPDSGSTWLLPRVVGPALARQLLMLDRKFSGAEAAAWSIAHVAVPDEDVVSTAEGLAAQLAAGPTVALGLTKALLAAAPGHDLRRHLTEEAYAMELSSRSPDFREGLKAFTERRPPRFTGR